MSVYGERMNLRKAKSLIDEYVGNFGEDILAVANDGCHKIYLLESEEEIRQFQGYGYTIDRLSDMKNPAREIFKMLKGFRQKCPLVYIDTADGWSIVPQW